MPESELYSPSEVYWSANTELVEKIAAAEPTPDREGLAELIAFLGQKDQVAKTLTETVNKSNVEFPIFAVINTLKKELEDIEILDAPRMELYQALNKKLQQLSDELETKRSRAYLSKKKK